MPSPALCIFAVENPNLQAGDIGQKNGTLMLLFSANRAPWRRDRWVKIA